MPGGTDYRIIIFNKTVHTVSFIGLYCMFCRSVQIFQTPMLELLCTIQVFHKLVNVCQWHPNYTSQSTEPSPCHSWLAIGSNESTVEVVDLTNILGKVGSLTFEIELGLLNFKMQGWEQFQFSSF